MLKPQRRKSDIQAVGHLEQFRNIWAVYYKFEATLGSEPILCHSKHAGQTSPSAAGVVGERRVPNLLAG